MFGDFKAQLGKERKLWEATRLTGEPIATEKESWSSIQRLIQPGSQINRFQTFAHETEKKDVPGLQPRDVTHLGRGTDSRL